MDTSNDASPPTVNDEADSEDDQQERIIGISLFAYAQHTHVHARVCASQTHMINQK